MAAAVRPSSADNAGWYVVCEQHPYPWVEHFLRATDAQQAGRDHDREQHGIPDPFRH